MTDEILHLVPNIGNFRLTLRTIKLWAKRESSVFVALLACSKRGAALVGGSSGGFIGCGFKDLGSIYLICIYTGYPAVPICILSQFII